MNVTAMMVCESKTDQDGGQSVTLRCVTDTGGKYAEFFKYTPWGSCTLGILSQVAAEQFEPGATYEVTFSKVKSEH